MLKFGGYMFQKIQDKTYYIEHNAQKDRPLIGLISGENDSLLIDAGTSPDHAREILAAFSALNLPKLKYLVLTHYHYDHCFGLQEYPQVVSIGSQRTKKIVDGYAALQYDDASLERHQENRIFSKNTLRVIRTEIPECSRFGLRRIDIGFSDELWIDLGGRTCVLKHITSPHTDDSTIVYVPEDRVLFLGDCLYAAGSQGRYYYDKQKTLKMLEEIKIYDAEYYLISHDKIYQREAMLAFFEKMKNTAAVTADSSMEKAVEHFRMQYHRDPDQEETELLQLFCNLPN
jgi:glyoxylase-like metal-dependent hydrolase (beta-lactamase superfamily II)